MMGLACRCDEGLGVDHIHLRRWGSYQRVVGGWMECDSDAPGAIWTSIEIPDQVKICVNWHEAYKELAKCFSM